MVNNYLLTYPGRLEKKIGNELRFSPVSYRPLSRRCCR